jgi:hypothetical protein
MMRLGWMLWQKRMGIRRKLLLLRLLLLLW